MKRIAYLSTVAIYLLSSCSQLNGSQQSVTIPSGQKFIMQLETPLHTRTTRAGDKVEFSTAAEIAVDNEVLIPNKSRIRGTVIRSKRAGRLSGRAEIQIRFDDIRLQDGTELPLKATITRMGFDPVDQKSGENPKLKGEAGSGTSAKTVAETGAQGAIIGVLTAGPKGAMYGAAAGAAIAAIGMALRRGPDLDLPRSTMFEARFDKPLEIPAISIPARVEPPNAPGESQFAANPSGEEAPVSETVPGVPPAEQPPGELADSSTPVVASAASPASAPPKSAAESQPAIHAVATISVKVRMVQVDAVVRDRAGRMIDNLKASDFRVYEDGILQEIQSFSRDELPLAVALVVDGSGSVSAYISELRRVAGQALNQLKPQDEVCLFSFANTVHRLEDLTTDRRRIADAIDRIHAEGATNITDALHDSVSYLAQSAPGRRHAVILISDNQQTANPQWSDAETIKMAMESETVAYSLKTRGDPISIGSRLPSILLGDGPVNKVTRETGGEVINVSRVSSLDSALGSVISRLRMRYSLSYYPSSASQGGAFHSITVRLAESHGKAGSDYSIHAKRGYYATGGTTSPTTAYPGSTPFI